MASAASIMATRPRVSIMPSASPIVPDLLLAEVNSARALPAAVSVTLNRAGRQSQAAASVNAKALDRFRHQADQLGARQNHDIVRGRPWWAGRTALGRAH